MFRNVKRKTWAMVLSVILICSALSSFATYEFVKGQSSSSLPAQTLSAGPYPGAPSYTIFTDGSGGYYAKNAAGSISFTSTNANTVIQQCSNQGGSDCLSSGTYSGISLVLTNPITIFSNGGTVLTSSSDSSIITVKSDGVVLYGFNITAPSTFTHSCIEVQPNSGNIYTHLNFHDLYLYRSRSVGSATSGYGLTINATSASPAGIAFDHFNNVYVDGFSTSIYLLASGSSYLNGNFFANDVCDNYYNGVVISDNTIDGNYFEGCTCQSVNDGYSTSNVGFTVYGLQNMFTDCVVWDVPSGHSSMTIGADAYNTKVNNGVLYGLVDNVAFGPNRPTINGVTGYVTSQTIPIYIPSTAVLLRTSYTVSFTPQLAEITIIPYSLTTSNYGFAVVENINATSKTFDVYLQNSPGVSGLYAIAVIQRWSP